MLFHGRSCDTSWGVCAVYDECMEESIEIYLLSTNKRVGERLARGDPSARIKSETLLE